MRKYFLTIILCLISHLIFCQVCNLTNQININTGFDPISNLPLAVGINDPRWVIDNANNIPGAVNNTPAIACVPSGGSATNPNSRWIGFATLSQYITNNPTVGFYLMTYRFPFRTCLNDSLFFDFNIANDNYCSELRIDGIPIGFSQPVGLPPANWSSFTNYPFSGFYLAGNHTIEIDIQNYNVNNAMNPHMLNIFGTLTSTNNSIVAFVNSPNCICNLVNNDTINAIFSFTYPNICDSTIIQFTDLSTAINSNIISWNWDFGDGNTSNLQNPIHDYLNAGTYNVSLVVTNNFFKLDTFTIVVSAYNNITNITANASSSAVCPGGQTTLTGSGGISYNWSGGISNGVAFIPSATSTYTVIGTDANGCTNTSAVTVTVHQTNPITITPTDPTLCLGDSVQLTASGANNYIWSNIPGLNIYSGSTVWAFPNVNTTFTVTGTDANGCTSTASVTISITTGIDVQITKNRDAECNINIVQLQATGAQNYSWTPANLLSNPNAALTNATVMQTTTFYLTGNTGSCVDMDSIIVYYYNNDETGIIIPNAFSPNGDGINDCLKVIQNANFKEYYFTIYNRWGERVFETDDPLACWNGEHKNKPAQMETYGYFLKAETICGKIFKKGDITLVR